MQANESFSDELRRFADRNGDKADMLKQAAEAIDGYRDNRDTEKQRADNIQARLTAMSKTILRLRDVLLLVADNIDDEGDRYYFGSTNDADQLKDIAEELDGWHWDQIISDGKLPDVYESCRNAVARAKKAEAKLAAAEKALEAIAALSATDMSFGDQVFAVTSARAALGGKPS